MKINFKIFIPIIWLTLTTSLGLWWFALGLRQAELVSNLEVQIGQDSLKSFESLSRQNRMLKAEGIFFFILLIAGGASIIWYIYKDAKTNKLVSDFFSTMTHEIKTPLASLRLQTESLVEDNRDLKLNKLLNRLLESSQRLETQLEKSLYLASIMRGENLFIEKVEIIGFVSKIIQDWKDVKFKMNIYSEFYLSIDKRALENIFYNLIENSLKHGNAKKIEIQYLGEQKTDPFLKIFIRDDGSGFSGNFKYLGQPFYRLSKTSGTGIGLYIVKNVIGKMKGKIDFKNLEKGFEVTLEIPFWKEK